MTQQIKHTKSEVYAEISNSEILESKGHVKFTLKYYDLFTSTDSTLSAFQYSTDGGSTWNDCLEPLTDEFSGLQAGDDEQTAYLYWDAATQLGCCSEFTDVQIRVAFNDQTVTSDYITAAISSIDFRTTQIPDASIEKPVAYDPYFNFAFTSPEYIRSTKLHFKIEIDTNEAFSSPITRETSNSTTDWTVGGLAFPAGGIDGKTGQSIEYNGDLDSELSDDTDYYFRIVVEPSCPDFLSYSIVEGQISQEFKHGLNYKPFVWFRNTENNDLLTPLNYQVKHLSADKLIFNSGEPTNNGLEMYLRKIEPKSQAVDGVDSITIQHDLNYYPFVWVENSDGVIQTADQYEVKYVDSAGNLSANHITVNFYETVSGMTVFYDLGSGSAPASVTATAPATDATISHDFGHYLFSWGRQGKDLVTANMYGFNYTNMKELKVDFYEEISNDIELYYRN